MAVYGWEWHDGQISFLPSFYHQIIVNPLLFRFFGSRICHSRLYIRDRGRIA